MKKRINKIWSVGLVVVILVSLLMMTLPATPAAASPLKWAKEGIPQEPGMLVTGSDVTDLAVSADGKTIYAATGGAPLNDIYKSIDGGLTWVPVPTGPVTINANLVAVSPDNANLVVAASATGVYVSDNGGAVWKDLAAVAAGVGAAVDVDISQGPMSNVAVVDAATVWYFDLGLGGAWKDTNGGIPWTNTMTGTVTLAARFSSNFAADQVLLVVTQDGANTYLEVADMSGMSWNAAPFVGYAVTICPTAATNAYIAPAPDYLGSDETARVVFVSLFGAAVADDGIYRVEDTNVNAIKNNTTTAFQVASIAYDGSTLVAGTHLGSTVWRSTNPLDTSPTFTPSAATKSPSGNADAISAGQQVIAATAETAVAFAGTNVVAGTTGVESAFAISTDSGKSFNDVSLIDSEIATGTGMMDDVAVAADGSTVYLLTEDNQVPALGAANDYVSLWRYASGSWQRVLCASINVAVSTAGADYILRTAAADANIVYVAAYNNALDKSLYYAKDGGVTRWYNRTGPGFTIADLAVESESVAYIATLANVQKTINGGFTWGPPTATKLGAVYTLKSISEGNLVAGGNAADVAYTTDGNMNWTLIPQTITGGANVQVTADGLASGNNIYAADSAIAGVYRWTIGQSATSPWTNMDTGLAAAAGSGLALSKGVLYESTLAVAAGDYVQRSTAPTAPPPPPPPDTIATPDAVVPVTTFGALPSALRTSATDTAVKLWILDTVNLALYSFEDTLAVIAPTLLSPADGTKVKITPFIATPYQQAFTWSALPNVASPAPGTGAYTFSLFLDKECTQQAMAPVAVEYGGGPPVVATVVAVANPGTTYYWQVKAGAVGGFPLSSPPSEVRSIITESPAAVVPGIASPTSGTEVATLSPAFSWNPISGTTEYQFQLSSTADFATPLVDSKSATSAIQLTAPLEDGKLYFWRVKVSAPSASDWSTVATFTVKLPVEKPPVVVTNVPAPTFTMPAPAPATTITIPAPEPAPQIAPGYIWAIIIIGAVLVIAVIVLVIRTRRTV